MESVGEQIGGRSNWDFYKELEREVTNNNLRTRQGKVTKIENGDQQTSNKNDLKILKSIWTINNDLKTKDSTSKQSILFLESMKVVIVLGHGLGLNPVMGILQTDPSRMRFKFLSWKFACSIIMGAYQITCLALCVYSMCKYSVTISNMAFVSFYAATSMTTIMFIRIAKRWPHVIHEISNSLLDDYVDYRVKIKCCIASIVLLVLASFEHILAELSMYANVLDCTPKSKLQEPYKILSQINFYWFFGVGIPFSVPLGIFIQILDTISMITWTYSDIFIICVSLFLISIFNKINKKIEASINKSCQPWMWRSLREDYTRATQLVRLFDDVIGGIVFVSFANNLFFICLQLFNVLQFATTEVNNDPIEKCPNYPSGPLHGYEYTLYYTFSLLMVISRFLAVSLLASKVHSSAIQSAAVLYAVPTQYYCTEIQRFIEQIHSDEVALSGLQFFPVTKNLVLSVAGTIVTYELVLLQFDGK